MGKHTHKILLMNLLYNYISIEGSIGAGKTSLVQKLAKEYNANLLLEQFADNPFLAKFYEEPERYGFSVELYFTAERYRQLKEFLVQQNNSLFNSITVSDFIFHKSLVFAGNNLKDDELKLYRMLFNIMLPTLPKPDVVFYLYASVDDLLRNIKKRGRSYEQNIKGEYLENIQKAYLDYFRQMPELKVVLLDTKQFDFIGNKDDFNYLKELLSTEFNKGITTIK
ncbi:MAG: deoxynucleoside kinase [Chitinophagales bacterium]|nr:deoxynucleoside kinase [Chitinophagales bacterium]